MVLRMVDRVRRMVRPWVAPENRKFVRLNDLIDWVQLLTCVVVFAWFCLQHSQRW